MATLKDISRIANVNVSTVSKALRKNSDLNPATIIKIRKVADELQYPYHIALSEDKKIKAIGVVCPDIASSYYMDILNSFQANLLLEGYSTIVMVSNFSCEQELRCINLLMASGVSGIACFTENEENYDRIREISLMNDVRFVLISTVEENDFCDNICIDDRQSVMMAVNHLIKIGHKKIAYIGDKLSENRKNTFISTLENRGLQVVNDYIVENELRFEECGFEGMKKLIALKELPTGIFAAYDNIAIGAMRVIFENGYSVPDDFSIVSIDNIKTSAYLYKSLTTVTEPTADLGEMAANLMTDKIKNNKKTIQHIKLQPTLNSRETTATPKL